MKSKKKKRHRAPLTRAEKQQLITLKKEGKTNQYIAEKLNVGLSTVTRIVHNEAPEYLGVGSAKRARPEVTFSFGPSRVAPPAAAKPDVAPEDVPAQPENGSEVRPGQGFGAKPGQKEQETERSRYLLWVANGAIRGWVDRLIRDIQSGELG